MVFSVVDFKLVPNPDYPSVVIATAVCAFAILSLLLHLVTKRDTEELTEDPEQLNLELHDSFLDFFARNIFVIISATIVYTLLTVPQGERYAFYLTIQLCGQALVYASWRFELVSHHTAGLMSGAVSSLCLLYLTQLSSNPFQAIWNVQAAGILVLFYLVVWGRFLAWSFGLVAVVASLVFPGSEDMWFEEVLAPRTRWAPVVMMIFVLGFLERLRRDTRLRSNALVRSFSRRVQMKDHLIETVSREIRSPLRGLLSSIDKLRHESGDLSKQQKGHLKALLHCATALNLLVENVLVRTSRTSAPSVVVMQNFIDQLQSVLSSLAYFKKGCKVKVQSDKRLPKKLIFPHSALSQVVVNFGSNAVKMQDKGHIVVLVEYQPRNQVLRVSVRDYGPGVPEEFVDQLFRPFARGDNMTTGTGLGLAISKILAIEMGGTIGHQKPEDGKGALFFVEIPVSTVAKKSGSVDGGGDKGSLVDDADEEAFLGDSSRREKGKLEKPDDSQSAPTFNNWIPLNAGEAAMALPQAADFLRSPGRFADRVVPLIVEDDAINQKVLASMLQRSELLRCSPLLFLEAVSALHWMLTNSRALMEAEFRIFIFLDVTMPIMSGLAFAEAWRKLERQMELPERAVIILTTAVMDASLEFSDALLIKPIKMPELKSTVEKLLRD